MLINRPVAEPGIDASRVEAKVVVAHGAAIDVFDFTTDVLVAQRSTFAVAREGLWTPSGAAPSWTTAGAQKRRRLHR